MHRPLASVCVVLTAFVLLAGCLGPANAPGTGTPTATPTDTPTPTHTPTTPGTVTTPSGATTVAYADLSPEARAAFDAALGGEAKFLPASDYVDGEFFDPDATAPFREHEHVSRNGTTYEVSLHSTGELYASYDVHAAPGSPGENATVVEYASADPEIRWAVENGSHQVPLGKWDSRPDVDYVRYGGDIYELSYAVGDYWVTTLEATGS